MLRHAAGRDPLMALLFDKVSCCRPVSWLKDAGSVPERRLFTSARCETSTPMHVTPYHPHRLSDALRDQPVAHTAPLVASYISCRVPRFPAVSQSHAASTTTTTARSRRGRLKMR